MAAYEYPAITTNGAQFTKTIHSDTYASIDPLTASNLAGRRIFITGASKGVGASTAISLAKAGASYLALGARSDLSSLSASILRAASEAGHPPPQILELRLDVQDHESVLEAAKAVQKEFGGLDVLINNAGYLETFTPVVESDREEWWKTWEINLRGVYWVTKALLPLLLKKEDGLKTVLNVSSVGAHGLRNGASSYQTTKLALLRFTEFLCAEYAEKGLLAYCVHPGAIMTDMGRRMPKAAWGILTDKPELAADTMVWLVQERRVWLAGRYISCTWDMEELMAREKEIVEEGKLKVRMIV